MADVESLELQITGDAQSAERSIDSLIQTLGRLKTAAQGGAGLRGIANPLQKISAAVNSLSGAGQKLKDLAGGLTSLSTASNFKISSNIANQITAINNAIKNLPTDYSPITQLFAAVEPLANLGKGGFGTLIGQLKKLPEAAEALNKIDMDAFGDDLKELAKNMKPLADEMQKVANGFAAFPAKIQQYINASNKIPSANARSAKSFKNLFDNVVRLGYTLKRIGGVIASWINESNAYVETLNLFTVAMGEYAGEAQKYAEQVGEAMGIDPAEWMRSQGVFMLLGTGFGIAGDRAAKMSQQLTQLGYDLSSLYNIRVEEAMQKLKSGFAGELEPLRSLGYDLSQAKLEAIALSLGIDKSVSSMTQAEKAELRYYAIMTQLTEAHGDLARTLDDPANQLRVLQAQVKQAARALGDLFIPMLKTVLPYLIAAAKVVRYLANALAGLFGAETSESDDSGLKGLGTSAGVASEALGEATDNATKLKKTLLGIDELNVMSDPSGSGSGAGAGAGGGFGFEIPTMGEDWLNTEVNKEIDAIVEKMKEWLGITDEINTWADFFDTKLGKVLKTVGQIATGIAAWKVSSALLKAIDTIQKLTHRSFNFSFGLVGAVSFMADLDKLKQYFEDFTENGPTFQNVVGMISEFAGLVGDALLTLGKVEFAGPLKVAQGVGEIASAIADIAQNGFSTDSVLDVVRGISNVGIAVGAMTKNFTVTGVSMMLQGITGIIQELARNLEAIKNGDWSGVDAATMAIGAVQAIGGLLTALGVFNKIKGALDTAKTTQNLTEVATVTNTVSTTTSTVTQKLGDLAKNIGIGVGIIAEVAAAAIIVVGAIWVLGELLEQVGIAWEPVIANGENVATAVGIGTGILVAIGVVTALLGSLGGEMAAQIGVGIAILAEIGAATAVFLAEIWAIGWGLDEIGKAWQPVLDNGERIALSVLLGMGILIVIGLAAGALGVASAGTYGALPIAIGLGVLVLAELGIAAGLFIAEIWAIGKGLDEIGKAWGPVLDNGETIAKAIEMGTKLLIAIGVVSAALGVASVASVGLLPLAIAAGTLMLKELAWAFVEFTECLIKVSDQLRDELHPSLNKTNAILPKLETNMKNFTEFMKGFVSEVVTFTGTNVITSIGSTVNKVIDFFTADPIKSLSKEISKQCDQMEDLVDNLNEILPVIKDADRLMAEFNSTMNSLKARMGVNGTTSGTIGYTITVGVKLAKSGWTSVQSWIGDLTAKLNIKLPTINVNWQSTGSPNSVSIPKFSIKYYAAGGFPGQNGDLFVANEAGPELVGQIGSRNAVVNNDQIVDAVARGVYQAVMQANAQSGDQTVEAKVDDKVLFQVLLNRSRQETMRRGYNPLVGGV